MTYKYELGQVPVPAQTCVRCAKALEYEEGAGAPPVGWFQVSHLDPSTWVFTSRGAPPAAATQRLRCPSCGRRYALEPR